MWVGHYSNEKYLLTGPWAFAIFFSIPQMLHDHPPLLAFACAIYTLKKKKKSLYLIYLPVILQGRSNAASSGTYLDVCRQG